MNLWDLEQNAAVQRANKETLLALANRIIEIFQNVFEQIYQNRGILHD